MFNICSSLTSLNLSSFNTSQVINMTRMFYNCSSLTSLNLSNFDTSRVNYMDYMFYYCSNLEYINLNKFDERKLKVYGNMFLDVPENVVICINENISKIKIFSQIKNKKCYKTKKDNLWN